jgi:Tfp pilus assembly protein PilN
LLLTKRVRLPPLPAAERRQVLRLEPQRFFPVRLEDLAVAVRDDDLVFAAREAPVGVWLKALEELGPVDVVEPGPVALARALAAADIGDATVILDDRTRGLGLLELRGGGVVSVRRLYGAIADHAEAFGAASGSGEPKVYVSPWLDARAGEIAAELPGVALHPVPDLPTVPAPFLSAYGAALGIGGDVEAGLLPDDVRRRIVARRRREIALGAAAVVAAAVFAVSSVDAWRDRVVERATAELRSLQARAAPALALQNELAELSRQAQSVAQAAAERPDPLHVLGVMSRRLPPGAYIRSLRLTGGEWHVDGYARRAAGVTQALGSAPELANLRVLAATNRAQIGDQANESFSLAFRLAARP